MIYFFASISKVSSLSMSAQLDYCEQYIMFKDRIIIIEPEYLKMGD